MTTLEFLLYLGCIIHVVIVITGIILIFNSNFEGSMEDLKFLGFGGLYLEEKESVNLYVTLLGVFILVVATIGVLGIVLDTSWLLLVYAASIALIGILLCFVSIRFLAYVANESEQAEQDSSFKTSLLQPDETELTNTEKKLQCCGLDGPDFYVTYEGQDYVPPSCCPNGKSCTKKTAYQLGCVVALRKQYKDSEKEWGIVLLFLAVLMFISAGIAVYFSGSANREDLYAMYNVCL